MRLYNIQHQRNNFVMDVSTLRAYAYHPDVLGSQRTAFFGEVVEMSGQWRWTFAAAKDTWGIDEFDSCHGDLFDDKGGAEAELMIVGRLLYACDQEDAKPDHERLHQICTFIKAARSMDTLTATGPLLQARAVVKSRVEELSDSLIGDDPWTSMGMPNIKNTCYINAVLQGLFHCAPFRMA